VNRSAHFTSTGYGAKPMFSVISGFHVSFVRDAPRQVSLSEQRAYYQTKGDRHEKN
jgi:hypothetical protein